MIPLLMTKTRKIKMKTTPKALTLYTNSVLRGAVINKTMAIRIRHV